MRSGKGFSWKGGWLVLGVWCSVNWLADPGMAAPEEPFTRVRPYNMSSHLPDFFRGLLNDRVWIYRRNGSAAGMFLAADGRVGGCWLKRDQSGFVQPFASMRWRIGTPSGLSNFETSWATSEGPRYFRMVLIYEGRTGALHGERFSGKSLSWHVTRDGWVQEGWPAVFVEKCGKLKVKPDIAVNEAQDTLDFERLRENAKRVVKAPGWKRSFPGATGLAKSKGKPTLTLEEVLKVRKRAHGKIRIGMNGHRWVYVAWPRYTEVWRVDDQDNVVDLGITRRTPDGRVSLLRWEKSGQINSYFIGYPMPSVGTGKKHSAFEMMDDLVAEKRKVVLADGGGDRHEHVFSKDGSVATKGWVGRWFISRGAIVVKTNLGEARYPWREVAEGSGWKGSAE